MYLFIYFFVFLCSTHKTNPFYYVCNCVFCHRQLAMSRSACKKKGKGKAFSFLKGRTTVNVYYGILFLGFGISHTYYFVGRMLCNNISRITILSKENEMCYSAIQAGLSHKGCVFNI